MFPVAQSSGLLYCVVRRLTDSRHDVPDTHALTSSGASAERILGRRRDGLPGRNRSD